MMNLSVNSCRRSGDHHLICAPLQNRIASVASEPAASSCSRFTTCMASANTNDGSVGFQV